MDQILLEEYTKVIEKNPFAAKIGIEILDIYKGYVHTRVKNGWNWKIYMGICTADVCIR